MTMHHIASNPHRTRRLLAAGWVAVLIAWPLLWLITVIGGGHPSSDFGAEHTGIDVLPGVGSTVFLFGVPAMVAITVLWAILSRAAAGERMGAGRIIGGVLGAAVAAAATMILTLVLTFMFATVFGV